MREFNAAALAALEAVIPAARVHRVGEVPAEPVTGYAVVSVSSGSAENYRNCGEHGSRSYRIVVQAIGKTIDEVAWVVDKADAAFLDKRLALTGYDTTPAAAEVASPVIRDPDAGAYLSVTLTYTFTAYPA